MRQVSVKTLILLIALLALAVACYGTAWTSSVRAAVTWLDDDPNQPQDPNQPADPNEPVSPQPEIIISAGSLVWLDVGPVDPNDPNTPPTPPPPEKA